MKHKEVILFSFLLLAGSISALNVNRAKAISIPFLPRALTYSSFWDSIDTFWIVGEVENTGPSAAHFVKITASFYDSEMHFINSSFTYTDLDVLNPGRKSPFSVMLSDDEGSLNVASYSISLSWSYTTAKTLGLQILSQNSYIDIINYIHVTGEIRNTGSLYSNFTKVIATFYDSNDTVVGESFTYTDPYDMAPGQTLPYEVLFIYSEQVPKISSYRLTAESWQYAALYETPDLTAPTTSDNHDENWHNADFTITLVATDDSGAINQTYYKINEGPTKTVSTNGQPRITMESANNTLEYWSTDYAGNEENHHLLTEIKLDKTPPTINTINQTPQGTTVEAGQIVRIQVNASAGVSGVQTVQVICLSNTTGTWATWTTSFNATTGLYEYTIDGQPAGTLLQYEIVAYNNAGVFVYDTNNGLYYTYTIIPEFQAPSILLSLCVIIFLTLIIARKRRKYEN